MMSKEEIEKEISNASDLIFECIELNKLNNAAAISGMFRVFTCLSLVKGIDPSEMKQAMQTFLSDYEKNWKKK